MANKVSFEDAVATLESMFPDWDPRDLEKMLVANRNHVENTIDAIFQVGEPPRPKANIVHVGPTPRPSMNTPPPGRPSMSSSDSYRGRRVQLPDDFLRTPNGFHASNNAAFDDEQLALMLQNEMFQREVAATMGRQAPLSYSTPAPGYRPGMSSPGLPSHYNAPAPPPSGDMKAKLSSMGAAAKRNLNNLALAFSRRARQNPHATNAPVNERETSALMNYFEDKPEEDEVITFEQRNPAAPVLPRGAPRHALEDPAAPGSAMFRSTNRST